MFFSGFVFFETSQKSSNMIGKAHVFLCGASKLSKWRWVSNQCSTHRKHPKLDSCKSLHGSPHWPRKSRICVSSGQTHGYFCIFSHIKIYCTQTAYTCIMPYNLYKTNAIILWSSFCKCDFHFAVFRLIWQPQRNLGGFWAQHPTWGSKQKSKVITSLLCDLRQDQFLSYRNQSFLEFYD